MINVYEASNKLFKHVIYLFDGLIYHLQIYWILTYMGFGKAISIIDLFALVSFIFL